MTAQDDRGEEPAAEDEAEDREGTLRSVPVSWEALEDAFENNAPEVHSYLHVLSGEVIRVVDGIADPAMHSRIASDVDYQRIDPVSSREQYRWMERFIASVEEPVFRQKLVSAIDGKGAFRRFKDVLMNYPQDRERWFQFRSERLRSCMEAWLDAHGLEPVEREDWEPPKPASGVPQSEALAPIVERGGQAELLRTRLKDLIESLPVRELETAVAFLEFLRDRRPLPRLSAKPSDEVSHG